MYAIPAADSGANISTDLAGDDDLAHEVVGAHAVPVVHLDAEGVPGLCTRVRLQLQ